MVVSGATEALGLSVPTETKISILTEILQPSHKGSEPLLPFNETLSDILLGALAKLYIGVLVFRPIARNHRPAPGDPDYLTKHPSLESLVVQSSTTCL